DLGCTNNSLVFDYTRVIRSNLIFEGRFGWLAREWYQNPLDYNTNASAQLGIPNLNDACTSCGGLAGFRIGGPVSGFDVGNSDHAHQVDNYGGYNFVGVFSWVRGSHTIKFGNDFNDTWRDRRDSSSQGN